MDALDLRLSGAVLPLVVMMGVGVGVTVRVVPVDVPWIAIARRVERRVTICGTANGDVLNGGDDDAIVGMEKDDDDDDDDDDDGDDDDMISLRVGGVRG